MYHDSETGYSVKEIDLIDDNMMSTVQSNVQNKHEFLTNKNIELNSPSHIMGEYMRHNQQDDCAFFMAQNETSESEQKFLFEFYYNSSNLKPLYVPTDTDCTKAMLRYVRDVEYTIPNLILAHTHDYGYVEQSIELTQEKVNNHGTGFSSYKVNSRKL